MNVTPSRRRGPGPVLSVLLVAYAAVIGYVPAFLAPAAESSEFGFVAGGAGAFPGRVPLWASCAELLIVAACGVLAGLAAALIRRSGPPQDRARLGGAVLSAIIGLAGGLLALAAGLSLKASVGWSLLGLDGGPVLVTPGEAGGIAMLVIGVLPALCAGIVHVIRR